MHLDDLQVLISPVMGIGSRFYSVSEYLGTQTDINGCHEVVGRP